jgi:starch-binding outer membrane protein, SusD/RagB family
MKLNKIILIFLFAGTLLSCKKLLEIEETSIIDETEALQTMEHVEQAVIGGYAAMQPEMGFLLNSTFSDEVKTAGEFYNSISTHEWQYGPEDVTIRDNFTAMGPWYQVAHRANRVLERVDVADSMRLGDNQLRPRLKAEAFFMRAYAHFEMFRYYAGNYDPDALALVYMSEVPRVLVNAPREKMGAYFQKMLDDLNASKTGLPNNLTDRNRATRLAAVGLHARIALYMRDWATAIAQATDYINAIPLSPRANFTGIWTDANNEEVAFRLDRSNSSNPYGRLGSMYRGTSASASAIGTVIWAPSNELWTSYDAANDIRFSAYLKDEPLLTAAGRQSRIVNKYAGGPYGFTGSPNAENVADVKVFRTGEMYLIRAEARAESGAFTGANSAESDINALRAARITGYTPVTFASKQEAIDAIILERFKELPFEGHRFWDLKRRGLPVTRAGTDAPSATGTTLSAGNFRFLLPIPQPEMLANKSMTQNPGY